MEFPFLAVPRNTRQRTSFHNNLARLIFLGDYATTFQPFMAPILQV